MARYVSAPCRVENRYDEKIEGSEIALIHKSHPDYGNFITHNNQYDEFIIVTGK
ncbi:MAG: hypothetical protein OEZ34_13455 [Spirochaetia bacterium]|nr:hypothetical protein [Spirochaetia bacterium]